MGRFRGHKLDALDPQRANRCTADYHWFGEVPQRAPRFRYVGDSFRCELDSQHRGPHVARIRDGDRLGDGGFKTATLVPHRLRASGYRAEIVWGPGDDE